MCGFTLIIILIIFGSGVSVSSRQFEPSFKAHIDTLELVQIIFRHGDRAPIMQYPNDPLGSESVWFPYADGFEALTKKGRQEHFELGKYWRARYEGFISDVYSPKEIFAQSSDVDRTIMSCLADLAGMWPPSDNDPKSEWNERLAWQPIPIHTIPTKFDNLINFHATCPRFQELQDEYRHRSPFARSINDNPENLALYAYLTNHTGLEVTNFEIVSHLHDTLMIQKSYGMPVPAWVDSVYDQMTDLAPLSFDPRVNVPNDEAKRVKAGPLLSFLVKNMDVRRNSAELDQAEKDAHRKAKFYILSGHDITNAMVLGAINVFDTQVPGYASAVIFEMHKGQNDQNDLIHYIRVFFRNETGPSALPYEFEIPDCGYPCKLDKFKELFKNIIIDGAEWDEACRAAAGEAVSPNKYARSRSKSEISRDLSCSIPAPSLPIFYSKTYRIRIGAISRDISQRPGLRIGSGFKFQQTKPIFRLVSSCEITLVIILCDDKSVLGGNESSGAEVSKDFSRQINQTLVLLKSILITSKFSESPSCVRVIVVADEREHFEEIKKRIFIEENWDSGFTQYLKLSFVQAQYPPGTKWMQKLFRPCATLRLFLPDLLPDYDTLIYLDTDIIFFRSVEELWTEFRSFSNVTLGGMAPCLFHYGTSRNRVPFYGRTGLNAGIMLMNTSRMRETHWTHKIRMVTLMFRTQITLADQDILNIYFHSNPAELHELTCDWNFRPFQCRGGSLCEDRRLLAEGISALHGNALSFTTTGPEPLFHTVFHLFQTTSLHSSFSLQTFIQKLEVLLLETEERSPGSSCVKYGGFNVVLINGLDRLLRLQQGQ